MRKNLLLIISLILNVIFVTFAVWEFLQLQKQIKPNVLPYRVKGDLMEENLDTNKTTSTVKENESIFVYKDLVKIKTPFPNSKISSPLIIEGEARGNWFFEGTFPIVLTDWDGLIIASGEARAKGEWTTENFVPFTAELSFTKPKLYNRGSLILKKDNPSGLPQNDDALEMPILFK